MLIKLTSISLTCSETKKWLGALIEKDWCFHFRVDMVCKKVAKIEEFRKIRLNKSTRMI